MASRMSLLQASKSILLSPLRLWAAELNRIAIARSQVGIIAPVLNKLRDILMPAFNLFNSTGFLLAVPKKRVSHRRKRMRNRNKFPKNRTDIEICVVCGNEKLEGHLCGQCYEKVKEETQRIRTQMRSTDLPIGLKGIS